MDSQDPRPEVSFLAAFQHPAWIVMMVAQMILGVALFVALILKYYMLVIGTEGCLADGTTLGNMIRCTPTLEIVANFVFAMAGFRFAAFMFQERPRAMLGPLLVCVAGVFIMFMSGLTFEVATWSAAAITMILMIAIASIIAAQVFLRSRDKRS